MYTTAVPISPASLRDANLEEDLQKYLKYLKDGNIKRVFMVVLSGAYSYAFDEEISSPKLKTAIDFFKNNGFETGVWIGAFGHGMALAHELNVAFKNKYRKIAGVMGESYDYGYCPDCENYAKDYTDNIKKIAMLNPDLIMIDDDFRLNGRKYHLGCFCEKHLEEFYRLTGEEIPRAEIEKKAFFQKGNKYRDAYMEMSKNTLYGFAKKMRNAVDEINPNIRLGYCTTPNVWDFEGTDVCELAKISAGNTKPFMRSCGAPYGTQHDIINVVEMARMEHAWLKNNDCGIEVFAEGDVYPRPCYNVSSKTLELYDLALACDGKADGILKYMFDYTFPVGYETGYINKHIKLQNVQSETKELFNGKKLTGVQMFFEIHKVRNWDLSDAEGESPVNKIKEMKAASDMIAKNGISSCYEDSEYPVVVSGEDARYISLEKLKNGAVIDAVAAKILTERGVDTGVLKVENLKNVTEEYYMDFSDGVTGIENAVFKKLVCNENIKPATKLLPSEDIGSYLYENADGVRFVVFASDFYFSEPDANYYNNYYRQEQLISAIEWAGRKKLPAVSKRHPNLYMMCAKNEKSISVLAINMSMDDVTEPKITLDKEYKNIKFVNCGGRMEKNIVILSDIAPYGFAAFEVCND